MNLKQYHDMCAIWKVHKTRENSDFLYFHTRLYVCDWHWTNIAQFANACWNFSENYAFFSLCLLFWWKNMCEHRSYCVSIIFILFFCYYLEFQTNFFFLLWWMNAFWTMKQFRNAFSGGFFSLKYNFFECIFPKNSKYI